MKLLINYRKNVEVTKINKKYSEKFEKNVFFIILKKCGISYTYSKSDDVKAENEQVSYSFTVLSS